MISIDFLSGHDWYEWCPKPLAADLSKAGLTHRFAVIQSSYVEGAGEMVFDAALWLALVDFVSRYDPEAQALVAEQEKNIGQREVPLADYVDAWSRTALKDKGAPACVLSRKEGRLRLAMFHENWASVGGPYPYADSYTYALFSERELGEEIIALLKASPRASGWEIADTVMMPQPKPPLWRRLLDRIL